MGKNGWFHNKIILSFYPSLCFFICLSCPSYLSACPNHDQKLNHGTQQCVIRTHYPNLKSNVKIASLTCHVYKRGSTGLGRSFYNRSILTHACTFSTRSIGSDVTKFAFRKKMQSATMRRLMNGFNIVSSQSHCCIFAIYSSDSCGTFQHLEILKVSWQKKK